MKYGLFHQQVLFLSSAWSLGALPSSPFVFSPPAWVASSHSWAGTDQYSAEYLSGNLPRPLGFSFCAALYSLVCHPVIKNKISWPSRTFSSVSSTRRVWQPLPGFFLSHSTKLRQSLHLLHLFLISRGSFSFVFLMSRVF